MSPIAVLIAWIPLGILVTGIYRATPVGRDPSPQNAPTWVCVFGWPTLAVWFLWWFTFTLCPGLVAQFCQWLVAKEQPQALQPDEVQQVLLGELTRTDPKDGEKS